LRSVVVSLSSLFVGSGSSFALISGFGGDGSRFNFSMKKKNQKKKEN